jgi:hypothetical protein
MAMRSSLVLLLLSPLLAAQLQKTVPAINDVEAWQQVGQQPYEMTWTQRQEHPKTLVDFEDLTGWTLELYDGAEGELRRSREQQMWGMYVAKFWYRGTASGSRIVARPPNPFLSPSDSIPSSFGDTGTGGPGCAMKRRRPLSSP